MMAVVGEQVLARDGVIRRCRSEGVRGHMGDWSACKWGLGLAREKISLYAWTCLSWDNVGACFGEPNVKKAQWALLGSHGP